MNFAEQTVYLRLHSITISSAKAQLHTFCTQAQNATDFKKLRKLQLHVITHNINCATFSVGFF